MASECGDATGCGYQSSERHCRRGSDRAIALANDSAFGLSGGVWSADLGSAERVARQLRTGHVILNGAMLDLEAPFGGVGLSGIGREYGRHGLEEFCSLKTITRPAA